MPLDDHLRERLTLSADLGYHDKDAGAWVPDLWTLRPAGDRMQLDHAGEQILLDVADVDLENGIVVLIGSTRTLVVDLDRGTIVDDPFVPARLDGGLCEFDLPCRPEHDTLPALIRLLAELCGALLLLDAVQVDVTPGSGRPAVRVGGRRAHLAVEQDHDRLIAVRLRLGRTVELGWQASHPTSVHLGPLSVLPAVSLGTIRRIRRRGLPGLLHPSLVSAVLRHAAASVLGSPEPAEVTTLDLRRQMLAGSWQTLHALRRLGPVALATMGVLDASVAVLDERDEDVVPQLLRELLALLPELPREPERDAEVRRWLAEADLAADEQQPARNLLEAVVEVSVPEA